MKANITLLLITRRLWGGTLARDQDLRDEVTHTQQNEH